MANPDAEPRQEVDHRFRLLTGGHRTAIRRQQTLEATIDWSYDLLPEVERSLLRCLSVFAGGWSLEAAESVCTGAVVGEDDVLELLRRLVSKSMVQVEEPRLGEPAVLRYRFLETIRHYAEPRLLESGSSPRAEPATRWIGSALKSSLRRLRSE